MFHPLETDGVPASKSFLEGRCVRRAWLSDNPEDIGKTSLIIAKHRNGEIGEIDMMFRASEVRFVDMADSLAGSIPDMPFASAMNNDDDVPFGPPSGFQSGMSDFGENQEFM